MRAFTIKDVAARAGVSPKTVSRVINSEPHVRPEVREAVTRVVAEMNYRPNAFARGLSSSRSFLIGLFFDDPASGYASTIQRGALERARTLGHHLVIESISFDQPDWQQQLESTLQSLRLGGAILTPPICDHAAFLDIFERYDVPVVRIAPGADLDRTPQVRMDDRAAARKMTEYLLSLGHRDIAFIKGNPLHSAAEQRWLGFRDAMTHAGILPDTLRALDGDFGFRSGMVAADALFDGDRHPTAVFACNDEMAMGVLVSAMRNQIAVPQSLSIVGFDDAEIARMAWPQLTTIHQPNLEMGAVAIDLLVTPVHSVEGKEKPGLVELPYTLVTRASSADI